MRITFTVTAEIDSEWLLREALRRTIPSGRIEGKKITECQYALGDALMHKDGIVAGSVTVQRGE